MRRNTGYVVFLIIFLFLCGVISLAAFLGAIVSFFKKGLAVVCGITGIGTLLAFAFIKNIMGLFMPRSGMVIMLLFDFVMILSVLYRDKKIKRKSS